jgi:hypothetical protein
MRADGESFRVHSKQRERELEESVILPFCKDSKAAVVFVFSVVKAETTRQCHE